MMTRYTSILFFLLMGFQLSAQDECTSGGGVYASWPAATWSCNVAPFTGPPGCVDKIVIVGTVRMPSTINLAGCGGPIIVIISGTLEFNTNARGLELPAGSGVIINPGGQILKTAPGGGGSTYISVGGVNVWQASMGTTGGTTILPVELTSFSAVQERESATISWTTASERNNDYFHIERSIDGENYETVQKVKGAGDATSANSYTIDDPNPVPGVSYYRISNVDFNGLVNVYETTSLSFVPEDKIKLSPNPAANDDMLSIYGIEKETRIEIYSMNGALKYATDSKTYETEISISGMTPGVYIVRLSSQDGVVSKKLIVK